MGHKKCIKMYLNTFSALNHAMDAIKTNEYLEICVSFRKIRHYVTIRHINNEYVFKSLLFFKDIVNKNSIMKLILNYNISSIHVYGNIGIIYIDKIGFHYQYTAANTIQKAWRKYFIRSARLRNDLVIHGLMEYWFHPNHINLLDYLGPSIKYII